MFWNRVHFFLNSHNFSKSSLTNLSFSYWHIIRLSYISAERMNAFRLYFMKYHCPTSESSLPILSLLLFLKTNSVFENWFHSSFLLGSHFSETENIVIILTIQKYLSPKRKKLLFTKISRLLGSQKLSFSFINTKSMILPLNV